MGLVHSPKIVTDGLVLALDAGNVKSYPGSGTTWYDKSGNGNNGTLTNGPTFSDGSIVFDGVDDYVNLDSFSPLLKTLTNVSFNIVAKTTYTPANSWGNLLFGSNTSSGGNAFRIGIASGTVFLSISNSDSTASDLYTLGSNLNNGVYHSISVCQNGTTYSIYTDGTFIGNYTSPAQDWTRADVVQIGMEYDGASISDNFNGNIALVQIYNHTLTASEVLQNYNATKSRFGL